MPRKLAFSDASGPAAGRASVGDVLRGWRRRLIASPAFQRWAAGFPLTRGVAERQSGALFDLCAGFVYSQILAACVSLGVFSRLAAGPRACAALADEMCLTVEATRRLLRAASALDLVEPLSGDRFGLGDLGAAMLGNPSIGSFVQHHALLYADLADPVALLRGEASTHLSGFWPYAGRKPGDPPLADPDPDAAQAFARYSDLMSRSQALIAEDVFEAFPPQGVRRWLDVGGGEGAFVAALAARAPEAELTLFDLPPVAARARAALDQKGLLSRVTVQEGDFLADSLPRGADVLSLVRILHDHDDDSVRALLGRAHDALAPGATLLIAEPMADARGAKRVGDAYFGFYLLAMGRGRARSASELTALLEAAGFGAARALKSRRPLLVSVLIARRM
jgi:demethylspheroidene O-methyltransferase